MPRSYHLDVVPSGSGAQLLLRDGHGEFLQDDLLFNRWHPTIEEAVAAVREFLIWEQPSDPKVEGNKQ